MTTDITSDQKFIFCMQCGTGIPISAKFCAGCGSQAPVAVGSESAAIANTLVSSDATQTSLDEEGSAANEQKAAPMTLGKGWLFYLVAIGVFALCIKLEWFNLAIIIYPIAGFIMTKVVMGGLIEWHPVNRTISNVVSEKISMFIFWPLKMAWLLISLSINAAL